MYEPDLEGDVQRREVLKAAAWGVPAVAVAKAVPLAATSGDPVCPNCFDESDLAVWSSAVAVVGNRGVVVLAGAFGLDSSACDLSLFQPAYTSIVTGATLRMSNGATYVGTGLGTATGTFGVVGGLPASVTFSNVAFPNGNYSSPTAIRPATITFDVTLVLVGLPSLIEIRCPVTFTWNLNSFATGLVTLGTGLINFTGTATDGTP